MKRVIASVAVFALAVAPTFSKAPELFRVKIAKDKQIVHALDRLTFGPRPEEAEEVREMGLKKWIDLQLHPERIREDATLAVRLAPLQSLRMTPMQTVQQYPTPQLIKSVATGREPMPDDPLLRVAVQRYITRLRAKEGGEPNPNTIDDMDPVKPLSDLLNAEQIRELRNGTPDQKRQILSAMPARDLEDFVIALPKPLRQQLMAFAPTDVQRKLLLMNAPQQVVAYDLLASKVLRAVYSRRQLAEELDDFWFNHFNIYYDKGADRFLIPSYERDAIRPNVLGNFRDLLEATAKSPAMLFYLDNFQSVRADVDAKAKNRKAKRGLNENYARELMELHTLGVDGGYTQHDIIEVARCFTGWTIQEPRKGGTFFYNDKLHDKGEKVVLGQVIPAGGGMEDGETVLNILARRPATARFISRKLAQRFVADDPPPSLIEHMAKTFLKSNGNIREVMKTMIDSREFWSQGAYHAKVKSPFEMVVSSVRALNGTVDDAFALARRIGDLGEPLYRKQEPTGYSNVNAEWVNSSALLARMNFALALAQNKVPGVKIDLARFGNADPTEIAQSLLGDPATAQTRDAIERAMQEKNDKSPALVAGLVIGSPDFQRR